MEGKPVYRNRRKPSPRPSLPTQMVGARDGQLSETTGEMRQTSEAGQTGGHIDSTLLPPVPQTTAPGNETTTPEMAISTEAVVEVLTQGTTAREEAAGSMPLETDTSRRATTRTGTDLTVSSMNSSQNSISPTTSRRATHHRSSHSEANDSRRISNHPINNLQSYNGIERISFKVPANPDSLHRPLSYEFSIGITGKSTPLCVQFHTVPPDPTTWSSSTAFPGTLPNPSGFKEEKGKEKRRNSSVVLLATAEAATSPMYSRRGSMVGGSSASGVGVGGNFLISPQSLSQVANLLLESLRRDGGLSWGGVGSGCDGNAVSSSSSSSEQGNTLTETQSPKKSVSFRERDMNQGSSSSSSASSASASAAASAPSITTVPQTAPNGTSRTGSAEVVGDNDNTTRNVPPHHHHHHDDLNTPNISRHYSPEQNGSSSTTLRTSKGNGGNNVNPQTAAPEPHIFPVDEGVGDDDDGVGEWRLTQESGMPSGGSKGGLP